MEIVPEQNHNIINVINIKNNTIYSNWEMGTNFLILHNTNLKHIIYSSWHINGRIISNGSGIQFKDTEDDIYHL